MELRKTGLSKHHEVPPQETLVRALLLAPLSLDSWHEHHCGYVFKFPMILTHFTPSRLKVLVKLHLINLLQQSFL